MAKAKRTIKWLYEQMDSFKLPLFLLTLLISLVSLSSVAIAILSKKLVDSATSGDKSMIYSLLIVYVVLVIADITVNTITSVINLKIWQNYSIKLRKKLYLKLVRTYWLDFNNMHTGDYVSRMTEDVATITSGIIDDIPSIISSLVKFTAAFCVLLYYKPSIAFLTFVFAPIAFIVTRLYSRKIKKLYTSIQVLNSDINAKYQEFFQSIQIVKTFNLEDVSASVLEEKYEERKKLTIKNLVLSNMVSIVKETTTWSGYFLAYSIGIFGILNGDISFGVLVVFLQLFNQVQGPLSGIAGSIPKMAILFASTERIMEIEGMTKDKISEVSKVPHQLSVEIKDVTFSYPNRDLLLNNVNLSVGSGEVVLVMGKSGSGKTTLIRLLLALLDPDRGEVRLIDEARHISYAEAGTRKWMAYVPQGNSLFSGTIASNIRYGNPKATDEEIIIALRASEAWEFVSTLPEGIDSVVGERGIGISEGQAQRIAIARALIKEAPLVIFDEVTSGLDAETEQHVMENIRSDYKNKTFIVITHREAAKKYADKIYYMENGKIIIG